MEKFNFLILDNREALISSKLKPSTSRRNMIYKSYLVSSSYVKIIKLESHYCIGREFWSVYLRGRHQIWLGGVSCHKTSQLRGRIVSLFHILLAFHTVYIVDSNDPIKIENSFPESIGADRPRPSAPPARPSSGNGSTRRCRAGTSVRREPWRRESGGRCCRARRRSRAAGSPARPRLAGIGANGMSEGPLTEGEIRMPKMYYLE